MKKINYSFLKKNDKIRKICTDTFQMSQDYPLFVLNYAAMFVVFVMLDDCFPDGELFVAFKKARDKINSVFKEDAKDRGATA